MQTVRRPARGHSITGTRSGCVVAAARVPSWGSVYCKRTAGLHEQQSGAFCLHVTAVVPVATSQCKTLAGSGVFRRHSLCTGPASGRSGRNKSVRAGGYDKLWQPRKQNAACLLECWHLFCCTAVQKHKLVHGREMDGRHSGGGHWQKLCCLRPVLNATFDDGIAAFWCGYLARLALKANPFQRWRCDAHTLWSQRPLGWFLHRREST